MRLRISHLSLPFIFALNSCITVPDKPQPQAIDHFAERLIMNGGFTVDSDGKDLSGSGLFAVSAYPDRSLQLPHRPTAHDILVFRMRNTDVLKLPQRSLGGWCEGERAAPPCWLDVTITLHDEAKAVAIGKACNQQSVAHLLPEIRFIATGGDGGKISRAALEACYRSFADL